MWRADSLEKTLLLGKIEGRRRRGRQRMTLLDGITDSMDMSLSKLGVGDGQGSLVRCSPWAHKESDTTEQLTTASTMCISSVQLLSRVQLFATPWTTGRRTSLSINNSGVHPNSCPLSRWCHPTISFSVVPFSCCLQSFPTSGSFQMSQLFTLGGQSTGVSASTSVLPMNTQDQSPLEWTGWISLQSKGLSRVFSNTTMQKQNSSVLSLLYSPTFTSIHNHWKNHSLDEHI